MRDQIKVEFNRCEFYLHANVEAPVVKERQNSLIPPFYYTVPLGAPPVPYGPQAAPMYRDIRSDMIRKGFESIKDEAQTASSDKADTEAKAAPMYRDIRNDTFCKGFESIKEAQTASSDKANTGAKAAPEDCITGYAEQVLTDKSTNQERQSYTIASLEAENKRLRDELEKATTEHERQISAWRKDMDGTVARVNELTAQLEAEKEGRNNDAETFKQTAAAVEREMKKMRNKMAELKRQFKSKLGK